MSAWSDHEVEAKVIQVLSAVPVVNADGHHYGKAFVTTYQLAIKLDQRYPELKGQLGRKLGGMGTGEHVSLSQYLGKQLSAQIKKHGDAYPIEGAFLSGLALTELSFKTADGEALVSSVTGTGYDLSLFRKRPDASGATVG
ncbi:hypothetical protein AB0E69_38960 [Kribbella sp. NPDC026611]|uniref:hypothetical protein n=1 Tax=Kribbella sp. NPDC026611 TaxID=3154911 RepID=UPI0033E305BF